MSNPNNNFDSKIFQKEQLRLADTTEYVVRGGRHLFPLLGKAFEGIDQIGVIGWSSQGPAQAQNLRDSLENTNIKVKVGLRLGSSSMVKAREAGFKEEEDTLGEMYEVIAESDMVILLISDAAQTQLYQQIFDKMKDGASLGLSHGFLAGYLQSIGKSFPKNLNVIGVCPKGMGPSVRRLYEQGKTTEGAGINCSFAVEQDINGKATDHALGWAVALGAPAIFKTNLESEYKSDIYGERGILLGAVHGICESLFRYFRDQGQAGDQAFISVAESITKPISTKISSEGILAVYRSFDEQQTKEFQKAYSLAYKPAKEILSEIYDEVASGNEIGSVIMAVKRHAKFPMGKVDKTPMWAIGDQVRKNKNEVKIDPITAGVYIATLMAQVDVLKENSHPYSEIANESIIEAVDSLNPYMDYKGVAYMIDNCSTTARLGARKWAPRFDYIFSQATIPYLNDPKIAIDSQLIQDFENHSIHEVLAKVSKYKPSVSISLV
jgi:ketol-acid reductoisomerase